MRGLALDPGEKVGWNTFTVKRGRLHIPDYGITPQKPMALAISNPRDPLYLPRFDVVVMEDWVLTAFGATVSVGSDMPTSQFIGQVRLVYWQNERRKQRFQLVVQPPRKMKTGKLALGDDRPDYGKIYRTIAAAPLAHDESHYVSSLLHTVAYFHRRYV